MTREPPGAPDALPAPTTDAHTHLLSTSEFSGLTIADAVARAESYRHFEDGYGLNAVTMEWFFDHYTPDRTSRDDWRVSPLRAASLAGLPPALVVTAGYDPLRDEGRAYAWRLQQEGTQADLVEFGGMLHGFLSSPMLLHGARRGTTICAAALREALVLRAQ